jgi:hypothetical protein
MHDLETDESFDLNNTYEYILSIQVNLDGFSFSVVCPKKNKLVAFKNSLLKISNYSLITRRFKEWIDSETLFQKPFKKIRIIVFGNKFTLIPEQFSGKELKKEIPSLLFEGNNDLEIVKNSLNKQEAQLLFALPNGLNRVIKEQFDECEILHPIKIATNLFLETEKDYSLLLIFDSNNFYLTLFNKNNILLTNSFSWAHSNDAVYYVLTVLSQLGIEPQSTDLLYAGKVDKEDETIMILEKQFNKTGVLSGNNPIQIPNVFAGQAIHHNFTLIY